jgi:hypothetical protein
LRVARLRRSNGLRLGLTGRLGWAGRNEWNAVAGSTKGSADCVAFFVLVTRLSWCRIQTPLGFEGLVNLLGLGELQITDLLWDCRAFRNWLQPRDQLSLESACLLRIQVTGFFGNINERCEDFVVAFFRTFIGYTSSAADFNGQLLTASISNKFTWLFFHVSGGASGLKQGTALLWALAIANLLQRTVTLLHSFIESLLFKGDLAGLLKVLITNFFLRR